MSEISKERLGLNLLVVQLTFLNQHCKNIFKYLTHACFHLHMLEKYYNGVQTEMWQKSKENYG